MFLLIAQIYSKTKSERSPKRDIFWMPSRGSTLHVKFSELHSLKIHAKQLGLPLFVLLTCQTSKAQ